MLRTIYVLFRLIIFLIYIEPRYWKIKSLEKKGLIKEKDEILRKTADGFCEVVLKSANIQLNVEGSANLPKDTPFVLTPNHSSLLDIPIILFALGDITGFVSKIENKKLPFFGRWISLIYSVYIDRSSARNAIKSLNEGAEIIKNGHSQVIFPEGTRTLDGSLNEFKAGSYKLAKKAGAKVIPVAIVGAYDLHKKGSISIKSGLVKVKFFEALDSNLDTNEMAEISQKLISEEIARGVKFER